MCVCVCVCVCTHTYIYLTTYSVTTYNFEKSQIYVNVVLLFELYFPEQFKVHGKIERKMQRYPIYLLPSHTCSFPLTRMAHLLQFMNLYYHILITKIPWLTLKFTFGVVYSMGLHKCNMTCVHHYSIIQSTIALRIWYSSYSSSPPFLKCNFQIHGLFTYPWFSST